MELMAQSIGHGRRRHTKDADPKCNNASEIIGEGCSKHGELIDVMEQNDDCPKERPAADGCPTLMIQQASDVQPL